MKNKSLNIRLNQEEAEMIKILREKYHLNISSIIRQGIRNVYQAKITKPK